MKKFLALFILALPLSAQITSIASTDLISSSRTTINNNFAYLDAQKTEYYGAYSAGTTYPKNAIVLDGGIMYVSLQASNTGNTPASSASYWTAFPGTGGGSSGLTREYAAAICQSSAGSLALNAASADSPVPDCAISGTSGGVLYGVAKFADDATYSLQGSLVLPSSLSSAAAKFIWRTSVTNTGLNAVWQLQTACVADNESDDPSWNTAQTVTTAAKSAANRLILSTISSVTLTGCAAGETMFWRVSRDPTHASDTLAATAELKSITFTVQ